MSTRVAERGADRVVHAARSGFARLGYGGASMRTIAADVGVTAMALYKYAPSKAALLQLVFDETMREVYGSLTEAVAGKQSLIEELDAIFDRSGESLEDDPDLLRFLIRIVLDRHQEELDELNLATDAIVRFWGELIERAVHRREIQPGDGLRLAQFVNMLLWGIITAAAAEPSSIRDAVETAKWAAAGRLVVR